MHTLTEVWPSLRAPDATITIDVVENVGIMYMNIILCCLFGYSKNDTSSFMVLQRVNGVE
jgi:hypothetical protein